MPQYPRFEYSMRDVKRAGKVLAGHLEFRNDTMGEITEAFRVANNWRDAHAFPMKSVRYTMISHMRRRGIEGVTAARLKRMPAIRRKLSRVRWDLDQLQDLGGCRAILPSMADVRVLIGVLQDSRHTIRKQDAYIDQPKKDGYRSHHLMLDYVGRGPSSVFDGRRIEIQVRTGLQHSWATAVESVGLLRSEDLKAGKGSGKWLRLLALMSAEFAHFEGCPEPPGVPARADRIAEIKTLNQELEAAATLDNVSNAVDYIDTAVASSTKPSHYLIIYENKTKQVHVRPQFIPKNAVIEYDNAEAIDNKADGETRNVVLVEVDKLDHLKRAYPNYFGDVQLFRTNLQRIVKGKSLEPYTIVRQEIVPPKPRELIDSSWLRRRYKQWIG